MNALIAALAGAAVALVVVALPLARLVRNAWSREAALTLRLARLRKRTAASPSHGNEATS